MAINGRSSASTVAVWIVGISIPAAISGLGTIAFDLVKQLGDVRIQLSSVQQHVEEHDNSAREWKDRILEVDERVRELTSNAHARPDPFTGTQGRELERRIYALERNCDRIKFIEQQVEELKGKRK